MTVFSLSISYSVHDLFVFVVYQLTDFNFNGKEFLSYICMQCFFFPDGIEIRMLFVLRLQATFIYLFLLWYPGDLSSHGNIACLRDSFVSKELEFSGFLWDWRFRECPCTPCFISSP